MGDLQLREKWSTAVFGSLLHKQKVLNISTYEKHYKFPLKIFLCSFRMFSFSNNATSTLLVL